MFRLIEYHRAKNPYFVRYSNAIDWENLLLTTKMFTEKKRKNNLGGELMRISKKKNNSAGFA